MMLQYRMATLLLVTAMFATLLGIGSTTLIPGFNECIFDSRRYPFGAVFHPTVEVNGVSLPRLCIRCTCKPLVALLRLLCVILLCLFPSFLAAPTAPPSRQTTLVQCENVACPPTDCPNPEPIGECCSVCIEPDISAGPPVCLYEGLQYLDQERFHPPSMMQAYHRGNSTQNPFCTECYCNNGEVQCTDTSSRCPPLQCDESDAEAPDGQCCKECLVTNLPTESTPGCRDPVDGRFFVEGESWHPTIPVPDGVPTAVTCVNCTCMDSMTRCEKLPCPDVPPCGPNDPVEEFVLCCPKCRPVATPSATPLPTPAPSTNDTNDTSPTDFIDVSPDITPCESPYIYKIYKHANYDSMAIENLQTQIVEIYTWTTASSGGQPRKEYQEISSSEFSKATYRIYYFIGWTLPRRVNGLSNRPQKRQKIESCQQNCSQMVVNMLRPVSLGSATLQCDDRRKK